MRELHEVIPDRADDEDTFVQFLAPTTRQILCGNIFCKDGEVSSIAACIRDVWHKDECNSEYGDPMMEWAESIGLVIMCPLCDCCITHWNSDKNRWMVEGDLPYFPTTPTLECQNCGLYEILLPKLSAVEAFELESELIKTEIVDPPTAKLRKPGGERFYDLDTSD
jgi:hypothetical protein